MAALAGWGVPGFDNILDWTRLNPPPRPNGTQDDVAKAAFSVSAPSRVA